MPSEATRETLTSLDKAKFLSASTRTQQPTVTPKLAEVYSLLPPPAEGEPPRTIDFDVAQESNAELLDLATQAAREASHTHRIVKVKLTQLRKKREKQGGELRDHRRSLRKSFEGTYKDESLALVGLESPPARAYTALREQNLETVERMRRPELVTRLGDPLPGHPPLEIGPLADGLEQAVQTFEQLTNDVTEMQKVRDESLVALKAALRFHRRVLVNVARIQEGYYRLAGLDDLADRIRITLPKRSANKTDEPSPDDPPAGTPDPEAPAEAAPAEEAPVAVQPQDLTP